MIPRIILKIIPIVDFKFGWPTDNSQSDLPLEYEASMKKAIAKEKRHNVFPNINSGQEPINHDTMQIVSPSIIAK